jgi:glucose/arabinose dehydrogenase
VFSPGGKLFLTTGERFKFDPAQDLSNHLGMVVRINPDGTVPEDNPFVGQQDARDEIWSYGHRNIEAAAIQPDTGALWIAEMGPLGGDELNRPEAGRNYGWPVVSWGQHYDGTDIPDPPTQPRFADAVKHWTPVISPSGMVFYTGEMFPAWRGSALIGGLSSNGLVRVALDGAEVAGEERIPLGARIRDVEQAPDGAVYVLTDEDDGNVWRLAALE